MRDQTPGPRRFSAYEVIDPPQAPERHTTPGNAFVAVATILLAFAGPGLLIALYDWVAHLVFTQ